MKIILVPQNYRLTSTKIDFLRKDADPQLIIYKGEFNEVLASTDQFNNGSHQLLIESLSSFDDISNSVKRTFPPVFITEGDPIFTLVPTMLKMMAELPEFETVDFSELLCIIVGAEPMPIPNLEKWNERNVPIRQGFGMTKVRPNLTSLHQDDTNRKKGSIGSANYYVKTKIVNEDNEEAGPLKRENCFFKVR